MKRLQVRRGSALTAAATFALVVLAACGSPGEEAGHEDVTRVPTMSDAAAQATREAPPPGASPEAGEETLAAAEATPGEGGEAAAAMTVEVVSHDIFFEPAELTIPADTDVTFILPNQGAAPHNFSVDELNIDVDQGPGATEEIVVNAQAGEYEFYCNVPGHREAGMVGTLIVSAEAAAPPAAAGAEGEAVASPAASAATPVAAAEATPEAAAAPAAAVEPVEVVSHDIFFEPKEVTIPANTDVTFTLPNEGVTPHNFAIDALGISVDIAPGETQEVVINAQAGTYEFYCNVPGHKPAGMVGTLPVMDEGGAAVPAAEGEAAQEAAQPAAAASPAAPAEEAAADAPAAAEPVEVVSVDIAFEPNEVTIPADTDVTFTLPNEGAAPHNFAIDELGIDVDIAPGETQEEVVNAPAGTYEFYCNVPGHREAGMVGTLTVE